MMPETVKISQLPALASPTPSDNLPTESAGSTYKVQPGQLPTDWRSLGIGANTIAYNGNRSYDLIFNSIDLTGFLSRTMRLRTTRAAAAQVLSTSLNGTTQYYSKSSPNKMTWTDDFVTMAWVKLASYPGSAAAIESRFNGTSGWEFQIDSAGRPLLIGRNANVVNFSYVTSYQGIPLNKWVHIAIQLDMSAFTTTPTTSYIMIDGTAVPAQVVRSGTNPTALIQAGNYEVGSENGGAIPFAGKLAQVAVFGAKVTQATVLTYISQGLSGSEPNLASAYSFNNSVADLNTTTPNDLTPNGSAVATNTDSPFGRQDDTTHSSTIDYAVVTGVTFSTNTTVSVIVPEGCTIPTSGGVSEVSFSGQKEPYNFPCNPERWTIEAILGKTTSHTITGVSPVGSFQLIVPIGFWELKGKLDYTVSTPDGYLGISTSSSSVSHPELFQRFYDNAGSVVRVNAVSLFKSVSITTLSTVFAISSGSGTPIDIRGRETDPLTYSVISARFVL